MTLSTYESKAWLYLCLVVSVPVCLHHGNGALNTKISSTLGGFNAQYFVAAECLNMMRVSYVGEICLNIRPQQTVAPSDHHPVGGQLESTSRVEEIVGSLLEHQPQSLHSSVLFRSKYTMQLLTPENVTQLICLDDLQFGRAVFEGSSTLIQLLNETGRGTETNI